MYEQITKTLSEFRPHHLDDIVDVSLMKRVDSKFFVTRSDLCSLLKNLNDHYTALEIGNDKSINYDNTYYDTKDLKSYYDHHNGHLNRYKLRKRHYINNNLQYLELKTKTNKGATSKSRTMINANCGFNLSDYREFLAEQGIIYTDDLHATLVVKYTRISLLDIDRKERLTIDFDLNFQIPGVRITKQLKDVAVVELKQNKLNRSSVLFRIMKNYGIRRTRFSKYCMGLYFLSDTQLRRNNFLNTARRLTQASSYPHGSHDTVISNSTRNL